MLKIIQYLLPVIFIIFGLVLKYSKDPRWDASRKMSAILIILGIITLAGRLLLDYSIIK